MIKGGQRNAENIGCCIFRIIIIYVVNGKGGKRCRRKAAEDQRIGGLIMIDLFLAGFIGFIIGSWFGLILAAVLDVSRERDAH